MATVALVGRPNVGKSTLFNRLVGRRTALESAVPGTTRDRIYGTVLWRGTQFGLIDTGGLARAKDPFAKQVEMQTEAALREADLILVVVDGGTGLVPDDQRILERVRKLGIPHLLVANKTESKRATADFSALGEDVIAVSALAGKGIGELLDMIVRHISSAPSRPEPAEVTLALVGRPNVGKSTLLNALLGEKRAIEHREAGTTRDIVAGSLRVEGKPIALLDTAGVRRAGKREEFLERLSALRTLRAVEEADLGVLLVDATVGPTAQDQHLAGFLKDAGKGILIAVNKWDAVPDDKEAFIARLRPLFEFIPYAPVVFISAITGLNLDVLKKIVLSIQEERQKVVPPKELDAVLAALIAKKPPAGTKRRHPKLTGMRQIGSSPPTFALEGHEVSFVHWSYLRYIENQLRQSFGFRGTAIRLITKDRKR